MFMMTRSVLTILITSLLVLGLFGPATAQENDAKVEEVKQILEQLKTLDNEDCHEEAIPLVKRLLAIVEGMLGPENPGLAKLLHKLAVSYYHTGRYAQAEPLYKRALAIQEKALGPEHPEFALSLHNLAMLYKDTDDYGQAEPLFRRALAIKLKALGPEDREVATTLNGLAVVLHAKRDDAQAELLLRHAVGIRMKSLGPEHSDVATSFSDLARIYYDKGEFDQAELLLKRALTIEEKAHGPEHHKFASLLNNLGMLHHAKGEYEQAELFYKRALEIDEKTLGPEDSRIAAAINGLAVLYHNKGDYARAETLYKRALSLHEKAFGPDHPYASTALQNLGMLYKTTEDYARAELLRKRALDIGEKTLGPEHADLDTLLFHLGMLYLDKGEYVQAVKFLTRSNEIQERSVALILNSGSENQKQIYLNTLSFKTDSIVSLHVRHAPHNKQAARLALTTILQWKGRALDAMTDQLGVLRRHQTAEDKELLAQLAATRSQLATLQISNQGQLTLGTRLLEIVGLAGEVERLENRVSLRVSLLRMESGTQALPITLDAVRQAIPADSALVELFLYEPLNTKVSVEKGESPRYVAYVLRRDESLPQWVDLGQADTIDAEAKRLRVALKDPKRRNFQTIARVLDERVMQPIRKLLGLTRHVFLSPDGVLNLIPFAALVDENGKYLIENYSLTYLTSGRDLLRLQLQAENRSPPVVIADPLYDITTAGRSSLSGGQANQLAKQTAGNRHSLDFTLKTYNPLPGTAEEAAALAKLLSKETQVLLQAQATEAALKQVNHPRVLHIATHGFFLPDLPQVLPAGDKQLRKLSDALHMLPLPARWENQLLRSGLVFAGVKQGQSGAGEDGVLTAFETAGLDLWGTKLVVLSACETGLGDVQNGVGVYGLRRALILAGSETQVMSLWKVSDAGTRDLMTGYYMRLQRGEGRSEALRQVQLAMLRGLKTAVSTGKRGTTDTGESAGKTDYRHPYYWAVFIPSGDWRSMDSK